MSRSHLSWLSFILLLNNIGGGLRLASLLFLGCLTSIHNRLQFGSTVDMALDALAARLGVPYDQ